MNPSPSSRRRLLTAALLVASSLALPQAIAQSDWPTKPIRFVVPFAPGGTSEIVARAVAAELSKQLGQTVYVENKPGSAGTVAMSDVAKSPPDGYTMILGHVGTLAVNPTMLANQPYDVNRDFVPVTLLAKVPNVFVIHPDVPAKNFKEFIEQHRDELEAIQILYSRPHRAGLRSLYVSPMTLVRVPRWAALKVFRKVYKDCLVSFDTNRYQLPHTAVGKRVLLKDKDGAIRFFDDDRMLASYSQVQGRHQLVENPLFTELLRADRKQQRRKYGRFKAQATRGLSIGSLFPQVMYRSLADYERLAQGGERWNS